ncbi:hypothetical protein [Microcoleus vaginatus]|uniref:hypothetical protein n=1 Tax=Microcoleus vaginatus TaxID=119532 RepID=UPI0002FCBF72
MSISNYAQHLLRLGVENLDWGDRGIMAIALFMPSNPQIANFPLLNKQYFQ